MFVPKASLMWRAYRRVVRTRVEYFALPEKIPDVDVLKLCALPAPVADAENHFVPTVQIDLSPPEEELWDGVLAKTRKVIRQARREGVTSQRISELSPELWSRFVAAYFKLWHRKRNAGALGIGQISELIASNRFVLSVSRNGQGDILSWHVYVRSPGRVRLHTTVSDIDPARDTAWNNLVGRAHRLHHWEDMAGFRNDGARVYDFGGVYRGTDDQEQMNIARFKQSFGGAFAETYDAVVPLTWKGRLALSLVARIGTEARAGGPAGAAA